MRPRSPWVSLGFSWLQVLSWGCYQAVRAPGRWWLLTVLIISYFYVWEKQNNNYQRSWLKTDVAGWRRKLFRFWLWKSQAAQCAVKNSIIELGGSVLTFLLPHWRQWALWRASDFLNIIAKWQLSWLVVSQACLLFMSPSYLFFLYWMALEGMPVRVDR